MKYKMFVADYDRTLGNLSVIEGDTVKAIKEYMSRGGIFVVCTGRMLYSIREILLSYDIKCPVISYQGAMMDDLATGERKFSGGIDYSLAATVTEELKKESGVDVTVDIGETRTYERVSELVITYEKTVGIHGKLVKDMVAEILKAKVPVPKITVLAPENKIDYLTEKYAEKYKDKLVVNSGAKLLVEMVDPAWCKGKAVERLSKFYGIDYSEIIAVGDSTNDIELISGKWHGVAVGDANEKLKEVADEITVPFCEQPVKHLLEKYCLD